MKRLLSLLLLGIVGWLALSACSPTDNLAKGGASKATTTPEATQSPAASAPQSQIVGAEGGLYPPQDIALVTSTGKPQFLDSYADW